MKLLILTKDIRENIEVEAKVPTSVNHYNGSIMLDLSVGHDSARLMLAPSEAIELIGKLSIALQQKQINFGV